jgi:enoyl-CoA hydratase
LEALEMNAEVNVVILTGKDSSFATGADIKEFPQIDINRMLFDDYFEKTWWRQINRFRKPLIAAINGTCFGGGFEIALMCDILIASDDAKFALPEIKLGLIPGSGGT